jgi:cytochrome c-type biogenesis protein CcmH/NrfG
MDPARSRLEARRDQALADLKDLEAQVAAGEMTESMAEPLARRYEAEAIGAIGALDALDDSPEGGGGTTRRRAWPVVVAFTAAIAVAFVALMSAVEPRPPGGFITGGVAADVVRDSAADLSRVTNDEMEALVAANPDVVGMRLALARRYVEAGDFSAALPHYFEVLDRQPNHPEALMYLGWMTYVSGDAPTGVSLLERSLSVAPDNVLAMWFLANATFYGLGDPAAAVPLLEAILAAPDVPAEVIDLVQEMLVESRDGER